MTTNHSETSPPDTQEAEPAEVSSDSNSQLESSGAGGEGASDNAGGSDDDLPAVEQHRAFVRMISRRFSYVYAGGGITLLLTIVGSIGGAWWWGYLWSPYPWLGAITGGLIVLVLLRSIVGRRARTLAERVQSYCEANDIDVETLRNYYRRQEMYPFFDALFDVLERRDNEGPSQAIPLEQDGGRD